MTIDPDREKLLSFRELGQLLNRSAASGTIRSWCNRGRLSVSGKRVYLEWILSTWGKATSYEAYLRFIKELNQ